MLKVGDKKVVKAAPASHFHKFDGERVEIIGISTLNKNGKEEFVYTFVHTSLGFGAMYEHGFK